MAAYTADIGWSLQEGEDFPHGRYSRAHRIDFDGGVAMPGSASPHVVGKWADPAAVDPEEMLVAALSSCYMLSFLQVARLAGFVALSYRDHAEGAMGEIGPGRLAVTKVVLNPHIQWSGAAPDAARLDALHHAAHAACYIANSVRTEVSVARASG
jgi:organic hydroperoxide reductase OsmC/OhrA